MKPTTSGTTTARAPGTTISLSDASVLIATQRAESGTTPSLPSRRPGISRNRGGPFDHRRGGPTDSVDRERSEEEGKPGADEEPMKTSTSPTFRLRPPSWATASSKLLKRASAVSAAEPVEALATAAVVLPSESSASVTFGPTGQFRHLGDATGVVGDRPVASTETTTPVVAVPMQQRRCHRSRRRSQGSARRPSRRHPHR